MKPYAIGVDIGGTNFRIGCVTKEGKTEHFEKSSSRIFEKNATQALIDCIKNYSLAHTLEDKVLGIGIGLPSVVSADRRKILSTPNLKGFESATFVADLEKALNVPVFLDRDVNFLLLDDIKTLSLSTAQTILGFYVGTGFGNAIFLNGKLYRGKNGAAGELGHIPLYAVADLCTCGNVGCAETRMSGRYLEILAKKHFPGEDVHFLFALHEKHPLLEDFVRSLALPIATEITILDPDVAVLSGGVLFMPGFPQQLLKAEIMRNLRSPFPKETVEIRFVDHPESSAVRGAGETVHRAFK